MKTLLAALLLLAGPRWGLAQEYDEDGLPIEETPPAEAEPADPAATGEPAPAPEPVPVAPPAGGLTSRRGQINITLTLEASLSADAAFKPFSLAPDVSYGVTDDLTVALIHSGFGVTGFRGSAVGGLCLAGTEGNCPRVYNNAGAEAHYSLRRGPLAVAAVGGLHALALDPVTLDVKVGARVRYRAGTVGVTFLPSVFVGLNERDTGNEGTAFLPVSVGVDVSAPLFVALGGGVAVPLAAPGDTWTGRVGLIAVYAVAPRTSLAASIFLPRIAGGDAVATGADVRTLDVWVNRSL